MSTCKDHTDTDAEAPTAYGAWFAWAAKKAETHVQVKCDECGLYKIWIPKVTITGHYWTGASSSTDDWTIQKPEEKKTDESTRSTRTKKHKVEGLGEKG